MTTNLKRGTIELISGLHRLRSKTRTAQIATFKAMQLPETKKGVQFACLKIFEVFYNPQTRTAENKALIKKFEQTVLRPLLSRLAHLDKPSPSTRRTLKK